MLLLYRKARIAAPAIRPIPAVATGAPALEAVVEEEDPELEVPVEVEDLVLEEVPVELDPEEVLRGMLVLPVPELAVAVEKPLVSVWGVTTGEVKPAGIEAAASWEVTAAGWLVMTDG